MEDLCEAHEKAQDGKLPRLRGQLIISTQPAPISLCIDVCTDLNCHVNSRTDIFNEAVCNVLETLPCSCSIPKRYEYDSFGAATAAAVCSVELLR